MSISSLARVATSTMIAISGRSFRLPWRLAQIEHLDAPRRIAQVARHSVIATFRQLALMAAASVALTGPAVAQDTGVLTSRERVDPAPEGIDAWRIRYWTAGGPHGEVQEATGIVLVPSDAGQVAPRGLIAWTHGTWGVASTCAPSQSERFFAMTPAVDAVRMGYTVVAPDYPGLGTETPHPYLLGEPTAHSVLDAVRAAGSVPEFHAGPDFVVWGESQGGHAALWTGMLAANAPELNLVGVAAGAPPTDLAANFQQAHDANARAFLTALAADSWSRYYDLELDVGKRRTPGIIRRLANNCIALDSLPRFRTLLGMLALRRDLRNLDFSEREPWAEILRENSVSPDLSVPLLIAQTEEDPLVAPEVTKAFARRACERGAAVRWIALPGRDHATTASQSAFETLQWIEDRFAGRVASNDCEAIRSR